MGSNGLTKASLPFLNYPAQINQGKIGPFFFICTFFTGSFVFVLAEIQFLFCEEKEKEI